MIVWVNGDKPRAQACYVLSICPARHLEGQEMPAEWVNDKNEPIDLQVIFEYGRAEVPKNVGDYLVKYGLASRTQLILPPGVHAA